MNPFKKPLTRQEFADLMDPELNKLQGLISIILSEQTAGAGFKDFPLGYPAPLKVVTWLRAAPYNFTVLETGSGQNRIINRIQWT